MGSYFMPGVKGWEDANKSWVFYHCRECGVVSTEGSSLNMGDRAMCTSCGGTDVYCVNPELRDSV